jgi:hypothetical protein
MGLTKMYKKNLPFLGYEFYPNRCFINPLPMIFDKKKIMLYHNSEDF